MAVRPAGSCARVVPSGFRRRTCAGLFLLQLVHKSLAVFDRISQSQDDDGSWDRGTKYQETDHGQQVKMIRSRIKKLEDLMVQAEVVRLFFGFSMWDRTRAPLEKSEGAWR